MTLFERTPATAGPSLHALVIGVGEHAALTALTTPPIVVRKAADWLLDRHANPDIPNCTVELLI
jgi:hypothetical protein